MNGFPLLTFLNLKHGWFRRQTHVALQVINKMWFLVTLLLSSLFCVHMYAEPNIPHPQGIPHQCLPLESKSIDWPITHNCNISRHNKNHITVEPISMHDSSHNTTTCCQSVTQCWRSITCLTLFCTFQAQVALRNLKSFAEYPMRMQTKIVQVGKYER